MNGRMSLEHVPEEEGKDYGSQELELPQKYRFRKLKEFRSVADI